MIFKKKNIVKCIYKRILLHDLKEQPTATWNIIKFQSHDQHGTWHKILPTVCLQYEVAGLVN